MPTCNLQTFYSFSCTADGYGGAIVLLKAGAMCEVQLCKFTSCLSNTSGGAIAAMNGAQLTAFYTTFELNEAAGLGGGALYSSQVLFLVILVVYLNSKLAVGIDYNQTL